MTGLYQVGVGISDAFDSFAYWIKCEMSVVALRQGVFLFLEMKQSHRKEREKEMEIKLGKAVCATEFCLRVSNIVGTAIVLELLVSFCNPIIVITYLISSFLFLIVRSCSVTSFLTDKMRQKYRLLWFSFRHDNQYPVLLLKLIAFVTEPVCGIWILYFATNNNSGEPTVLIVVLIVIMSTVAVDFVVILEDLVHFTCVCLMSFGYDCCQFTDESRLDCYICLQPVSPLRNVCLLLECQHVFHITCLQPWQAQGKSTCPICRRYMRNILSLPNTLASTVRCFFHEIIIA